MGEKRAPVFRVLVVEDDEDSRDALVDALTHAGYEVSWAEDGQSAAELLRRQAPDLVVLDLMLPVLSGWELLDDGRRIRLRFDR